MEMRPCQGYRAQRLQWKEPDRDAYQSVVGLCSGCPHSVDEWKYRRRPGSVLTHAEMNAGNTFDRPNEVKLAPFPVTVRGNNTEISIPKHAVVSLQLRMA
jgi:hypothetical protein